MSAMTVQFSNSQFPPLDVPESNLLAILSPKPGDDPLPIPQLTEHALDHPFGSEPLEKLVSPSARVLILVDDITRQTPAASVLPAILKRIEGAAVPRTNIRFLIASGTHARMTPEEIERKLGAEVVKNYFVTLHHWRDEQHLRVIGTVDAVPVRVNRMLGDADVVVGVGQIVPHRVMGFTGGASIVQPGVSGPEVTGHTHWMSALHSGLEIMGVADNPVRVEVEGIARMAGLRFIVNVVMDGQHRVNHVVAGDVKDAHRAGAKFSRSIFGLEQELPAEIVVAESFPADYDLWQGAKGIYAAEHSVRQGGVVILVAPCDHGVSEEHPDVERLGYRPVDEVKKMVASRQMTDLVAAAHIAHNGRVIREMATGILVSPGIRPAVQKHLGFRHAATPKAALETALEIAGKSARVAVLLQGGHILPVIQSQRSHSAPSAAL
jgi:nickel-dependent lactate racemase